MIIMAIMHMTICQLKTHSLSISSFLFHLTRKFVRRLILELISFCCGLARRFFEKCESNKNKYAASFQISLRACGSYGKKIIPNCLCTSQPSMYLLRNFRSWAWPVSKIQKSTRQQTMWKILIIRILNNGLFDVNSRALTNFCLWIGVIRSMLFWSILFALQYGLQRFAHSECTDKSDNKIWCFCVLFIVAIASRFYSFSAFLLFLDDTLCSVICAN